MLFSSSYLLEYFVHFLPLLLCMWTVWSDVADGNDGHSLIALNGEQTLHGFDIVITYPAGAKTMVSGSETKVHHGNACGLPSSGRTQQPLTFLKHSTYTGADLNQSRL